MCRRIFIVFNLCSILVSITSTVAHGQLFHPRDFNNTFFGSSLSLDEDFKQNNSINFQHLDYRETGGIYQTSNNLVARTEFLVKDNSYLGVSYNDYIGESSFRSIRPGVRFKRRIELSGNQILLPGFEIGFASNKVDLQKSFEIFPELFDSIRPGNRFLKDFKPRMLLGVALWRPRNKIEFYVDNISYLTKRIFPFSIFQSHLPVQTNLTWLHKFDSCTTNFNGSLVNILWAPKMLKGWNEYDLLIRYGYLKSIQSLYSVKWVRYMAPNLPKSIGSQFGISFVANPVFLQSIRYSDKFGWPAKELNLSYEAIYNSRGKQFNLKYTYAVYNTNSDLVFLTFPSQQNVMPIHEVTFGIRLK